MLPTFIFVAIYGAIAIVIGLLVIRYARWRPAREAAVKGPEIGTAPRGFGCGVVATVGVLLVMAVLAYLWAVVLSRH
jgi:hypothetical protein